MTLCNYISNLRQLCNGISEDVVMHSLKLQNKTLSWLYLRILFWALISLIFLSLSLPILGWALIFLKTRLSRFSLFFPGFYLPNKLAKNNRVF